MRLLTIQLLLLGTQLISAAPGDNCDAANIKGVQDTEYTYSTSKELTCKDGSKDIEIASIPKKRYAMLNCDVGEGWKDGANKLSISATKDITIKCKTKACDESLITGYDNTKMKYDASKTLKCNNAYEKVKYSNNKLTAKLECKNNKWMADAGDTGIPGTDEVTVAGCKIIPCHDGLVQVTGRSYNPGTKVLTCTNGGEQVKIGGKFYGSSLTCDDTNGWTPSGILATEKVTGKCEVDPTCTTTLPPNQIDNDSNVPGKITCKTNNDLKAFQVGSAMHPSLTCDSPTWSSPDGTVNNPANTPLSVTCVDYCQSTKGSHSVAGGVATVKCNPNEALVYTKPDGSKRRADGDSITCSWDQKWKAGTEEITSDVKNVLNVECVKACTAIKRDKAGGGGVEDGLTADADKQLGSPIVFTCKNVDGKKGIMLDGKLVNSNLKCDEANGYHDIENKKLADAFDEVKISCGKSHCEIALSMKPCSFINNNPVPDGYVCVDTLKSPQKQSDDPNLLQCNKDDNKEKLKLYIKETDKFVDEPLRCEGDNFYKYDDSTKTTIATKSSVMVCLQKICGTCVTLPPVATYSTLPTHTDGTSDDCAKAECPNDLWMVEIESQPTPEEYSGKVECSSVKDTKTKWLINRGEPKKLQAASCVAAITSCNAAATLKVDCEESWKERGCERIIVEKIPSDGAQNPPSAPSDAIGRVNTCSDGLKMFYKQPNDGYALNDKPADTMVCTPKGWALSGLAEPVILLSGGTIVCAKENPSPVTTTTPPTTTTPFVNPCDVCPQELYSCDKCSEKVPQFNPTSDNEKCQAMALASETSFETEKEGLVKGKLSCDKAEKIWKSEDGKEVGKFALPNSGDADTAENTGLIIGGAVGGVVFLIAILAVIFYVVVGRKKAPKEQDEDTKRKMLEEGKKKKKTKDGDNNDEILDEVAVDAPAEIKL